MNYSNLSGGKGKIIPAYIEPINTPYLTTTHKEIQNKEIQNKAISTNPSTYNPSTGPSKQKNEDKKIVDSQVYQDIKNPSMTKQSEIPLQPMALTSPFFPPQFQSYLNNFMKNFYTPFVYKDYHINIGGPNANHIQASMVYEDALPTPNIFTSYKSLKERNGLCYYIRGTFISVQEGESVDFSGGPQSLNSRLKLIELNPYNTNYYSSNPYKGLPQNMLIYRSCYPITYDKKEATVQCQKTSIGLNMRVYRLSIDEYNVIKPELPEEVQINQAALVNNQAALINNQVLTTNTTNLQNYTDIRNQVIANLGKIPDPFIQKIIPVQNKNKTDFDVWREVEYYAYIRNIINKEYISPNFVKSYCYFMNNDSQYDFTKNTMKINPENGSIIKYSNKSLILLTESPNNNIYSWASDIYVKEQNIQKQIYSGYKPDNVWESVIMQILIIFYVMEKHLFTFNDMQLQQNFYIKDINVYGDSFQFWKFKINDIEYYVPNYGHLVMLDSDFHDIENQNKYKHKIIGRFLSDDIANIKDQIYLNAIICLNPNNFGQEFKNQGGVRPSDNIIKLLNNICTDIRTYKSIDKVIENNLIKYIHNRVGTLIRQHEVSNIKKNDIRPFRKGELVIYENKFDSYEILLYVSNKDEYECVCAGKNDYNDPNIILVSISKDLLYHYSEYESIRQDTKPGEPSLNLDYIIESYTI